ncbi:hypothetical protein [Streptomyces canus]
MTRFADPSAVYGVPLTVVDTVVRDERLTALISRTETGLAIYAAGLTGI